MNIASALLNTLLTQKDFETWSNLRKHYLPSEFHTLFTVIEKHCEKNHGLPSFEDLKFGVRDAKTRAQLFAVESLEVDVEPSLLLEYLKNEFTQREILGELETYIDNSIAFESAEESLNHLQQIIINVEAKVDIKDPGESMERISLFETDEELSKYIVLGLNNEYDNFIKFSPRDLIFIGGKRGAGKSLTCANIAVNVKNSGATALYFTIEMNSRDTLQRCCSIDTGVHFGRLRSKNLTPDEWDAVAKWWAGRREHGDFHYDSYLAHRDFDKLHEGLIKENLLPNQIDVIYDPSLTLSKIQSEVDKRVSKGVKIGVIIVDYINKVRKTTMSSKPYDWVEQVEVAVGLKEKIAQEYEIPVVSPYQIDANGEARFAKGILDSADAAFTMNTYTHEDCCITFNCVKMRSNEERSFTTEVNWQSLKIGPNTALTPKERDKEEEKSAETSHEEVPF